MKRESLLTVFKTLAPALVAGDTSSLMSSYCCGDGNVASYNGIIGLWAVIDLGVTGGLPGDKTLAALSACNFDEVEVSQKGNEVRIKGGRTTLKLATIPVPSANAVQAIFQPSEDDETIAMEWVDELSEAIRRCNPSLSEDPARPELIGITMMFEEGKVYCFASSGISIAQAVVEMEVEPGLVGSSFIMQPRYVAALTTLLGQGKCLGVRFGSNHLHAVFDVGGQEIHLSGNFIADADPERYRNAIDSSQADLVYVKIPDGLAAAIDRAIVLAGASGYSTATVVDEQLKLVTTADVGSIADSFDLPGHPDMEMRLEPARLKPMLETAAEIAFGETCLGLRGDGLTYSQAGGPTE